MTLARRETGLLKVEARAKMAPDAISAVLTQIDQATQLLAEADSAAQVKQIADWAERSVFLFRQQGAAIDAVNHGQALRLRAHRRLGDMLRDLKLRRGQPKRNATDGRISLKLDEIGISRKQASIWQRMARIEDRPFEDWISEAKENGLELTTASVLRLLHTSGQADYDGDEWFTPSDLLANVRSVLGEIDLDPASTRNAQATVKAAKFYTKTDDGLTKPWPGRVFCNPPYSTKLVAAFTVKLLEEFDAGRTTAAIYLVNNCTDADWCQSLLRQRRFPVCLTDGRIGFLNSKGQQFATRQGQAIFYLGADVARFTEVFEPIGAIR